MGRTPGVRNGQGKKSLKGHECKGCSLNRVRKPSDLCSYCLMTCQQDINDKCRKEGWVK